VLPSVISLVYTHAFPQEKQFGQLKPTVIGEAAIAVQEELRCSFDTAFHFIQDQHEYTRRQLKLTQKSPGSAKRRHKSAAVSPFRGSNVHPSTTLFNSPSKGALHHSVRSPMQGGGDGVASSSSSRFFFVKFKLFIVKFEFFCQAGSCHETATHAVRAG
jgi:hypothetical protein